MATAPRIATPCRPLSCAAPSPHPRTVLAKLLAIVRDGSSSRHPRGYMTPPPRPGIPLQVFWHFPARKDRARFCRHAKNFFRLPPAISTRPTKPRTDSLFCVLPLRLALPGQQHPCTILTTGHGIPLHTAAHIGAILRRSPTASGSMRQDQERHGIARHLSKPILCP